MRWSNGEVLSSLLRDKLVNKKLLKKSSNNYENFALGGAVVNNELSINLFNSKSLTRIGNGSPLENPESFIFTRPLDCEAGSNCPTLDEGFFAPTNPLEGSQIDLFDDGNHDKDLIVIVIGGNDLSLIPLDSTQDEIDEYIEIIVNGYIEALKKLYNKGGRNFILVTPADASQLPPTNHENVDDLTELTEPCLDFLLSSGVVKFSTLLKTKIEEQLMDKPLYSEANIRIANLYQCMRENEINNGWENLGFTNIRGSCLPLGDRLPPKPICDNVRSFVWFDNIHFTEPVHKYLARQLFQLITKNEGCLASTVFTPTDFPGSICL